MQAVLHFAQCVATIKRTFGGFSVDCSEGPNVTLAFRVAASQPSIRAGHMAR